MPDLRLLRFLPDEVCFYNASAMEQSVLPALNQPALHFAVGRPRAIDLKLRLALCVAALAAVCFLAVAAYQPPTNAGSIAAFARRSNVASGHARAGQPGTKMGARSGTGAGRRRRMSSRFCAW